MPPTMLLTEVALASELTLEGLPSYSGTALGLRRLYLHLANTSDEKESV